jgi:hypothetical protein
MPRLALLSPSIARIRFCLWFLAAVFILPPSNGWTLNAAERISWATGRPLQQKLAEPVDILWKNNPLRQAIENLSHAKKVAILIDRRVDPGQRLEASLKEEPLESALQKIANPLGLGVCRLGSVIYLGPQAVVDRLPPVARKLSNKVSGLSADKRRKFLSPKGIRWDDLAQPRELLEQLGAENGVKIVGLERIPHDLWAAADLPPCSLLDRLALIAIQFDMTFDVSPGGKQLFLVPLGEADGYSPEGGSHASLPRTGPKNDHPQGKNPSNGQDIRINHISVKEKPLGPVLKQLAERLHLELRIDEKAIEAAGISLEQRVSIHAENASIDEVFGSLLKSTRLAFHRNRQIVEIVPEKTEKNAAQNSPEP